MCSISLHFWAEPEPAKKEEQGHCLCVLWLEATGVCGAKTARNGWSQKGGGELTNLRFNSRKAVCLPKASSTAKKNVSNSKRFFCLM